MQAQYLNTPSKPSRVTDAIQGVYVSADHQKKQTPSIASLYCQYVQYISVAKINHKNEQGESISSFTFKINYAELANQIEHLLTVSDHSTFTLLGPVSYLYLLQENFLNGTDIVTDVTHKFNDQEKFTLTTELLSELLPQLLTIYHTIFTVLKHLTIEKVQLDEPVLALSLNDTWEKTFRLSYQHIKKNNLTILLGTSFNAISGKVSLINGLNFDGIHLENFIDYAEVESLINTLPENWTISLGLIDSCQPYPTDLFLIYQKLLPLYKKLTKRLWLNLSGQLLPVKASLNSINKFELTKQKYEEISLLNRALTIENTFDITVYSDAAC